MAKDKIIYSANTDVGVVRAENEDWFGISGPKSIKETGEDSYLFIVADGMGGHAHGEKASKSAVMLLMSQFKVETEISDTEKWLESVMKQANRKVFDEGKSDPKGGKRGTTLTTLLIKGNTATIGHVGDSRVYLIRNGEIRQLTEDHSLVARLLKEGQISEKEAMESTNKNILLQAVGDKETVKVDTSKGKIMPGDVFVLTSDGLTNEVSDKEIMRIAQSYPPDEATEKLISLANKRGGHDNITVIVVKVGEVKAPLLKGIPISRKLLKRIAIVAGIAIALILVIWAIRNYYAPSEEEEKPEKATELMGYDWEKYAKEHKPGEPPITTKMPENVLRELKDTISKLNKTADGYSSDIKTLKELSTAYNEILSKLNKLEKLLIENQKKLKKGLSDPDSLAGKDVIRSIDKALDDTKGSILDIANEIHRLRPDIDINLSFTVIKKEEKKKDEVTPTGEEEKKPSETTEKKEQKPKTEKEKESKTKNDESSSMEKEPDVKIQQPGISNEGENTNK